MDFRSILVCKVYKVAASPLKVYKVDRCPSDRIYGTSFLISQTAGPLISTEGAPTNEVLIRKRSERSSFSGLPENNLKTP